MCDETSTDRLLAVVSGRVQGVGYRWWAKQAADRRGLVGSVRNRPDRTVEVRAEGEQEALAAFVGDLFRGPPHGRVDGLDLVWGPAEGGLDAFEITS